MAAHIYIYIIYSSLPVWTSAGADFHGSPIFGSNHVNPSPQMGPERVFKATREDSAKKKHREGGEPGIFWIKNE